MRIVKTVTAMQRLARNWRSENVRVGLVPTMGYLHDGHLSLVQRARKLVGPQGRVVVSIYVNPTQFGPNEDLARYPRDFARDKALCQNAGVDAVFFPDDLQMYPGKTDGAYSTYVVEEQLAKTMEGAARPTHFRGVTTVVAKLFNLVLPDVAVFGAKDFQQATIIQRMVVDLNFPLKVVVAPTFREKDGLAMSSRNKYLNPDERQQALILKQTLDWAKSQVQANKKGLPAAKLKRDVAAKIESQPLARLDYVEFFDPQTLQPATEVKPGARMALAVYLGKTRLIDNATV